MKIVQKETLETAMIGNTLSTPSKKMRESQYNHWCFTYNNFTNGDKMEMEQLLKKYTSTYTFEKEIGKKGTRHLQGYFKLNSRKRITELKKIFGDNIHFEKTNNIKASIDYCQKDAIDAAEISSKNVFTEKMMYYELKRFIEILFEEEYDAFYDDILNEHLNDLIQCEGDIALQMNLPIWVIYNRLMLETIDRMLHQSEDEEIVDKFIRCQNYKSELEKKCSYLNMDGKVNHIV